MFSLIKICSALPRHALPSGCKNCAAIAISIRLQGASLSTLFSPSPPDEEQHDQSHHEQQQSQLPTKNMRLEAIKSAGITQLHNTTQDLISRTRDPLFNKDLLDAHGHKKPSIAQIQEANRLESAIMDALSHYSTKHNTFLVGGECIDLLGVEVSPDLRQAKAYWCLPRSLDLNKIPTKKIEQIVRKMQQILDERGGKIQGLVHTRLRAYYPPKIYWVAADHVSKDLKRGVSLQEGKNKWR